MRTGSNHVIRVLTVALAALAIAAPVAAAAGQPPDSRPYYRGSEAALAPPSTSPDDRAYSRWAMTPPASKIVSPDDRAFARSTPLDTIALAAAPSVRQPGFDWGDALVGGMFGLLVAVLGAAATTVGLRHRRSALETA
jgi:hypothetical protein